MCAAVGERGEQATQWTQPGPGHVGEHGPVPPRSAAHDHGVDLGGEGRVNPLDHRHTVDGGGRLVGAETPGTTAGQNGAQQGHRSEVEAAHGLAGRDDSGGGALVDEDIGSGQKQLRRGFLPLQHARGTAFPRGK